MPRFWLECSVGCICDASCSEIPLIGELAIGFVTPCVLSVSESVFNCSITVFVVVELLLLISLLLALLLLFVLSVQLLLLLVFFFSFVFVCCLVVGLVVFFLNLWAIVFFKNIDNRQTTAHELILIGPLVEDGEPDFKVRECYFRTKVKIK